MSATAVDPELVAALAGLAGSLSGSGGEPEVLSARGGGLLVRSGDVVAKAHPADTDRTELAARVRVATHPLLRGILLPPLTAGADEPDAPILRVRDRLVTLWPAGQPLDPAQPGAVPWAEAGRLLARLHAVSPAAVSGPAELPRAGGPARVRRALRRLDELDGVLGADERAAVERIRDACRHLPPEVCAEPGGQGVTGGGGDRELAPTDDGCRPTTLAHGDWHLGQLVRPPDASPTGLVLIDVDDLGLGDPAWDLARPAAWYAVGLLDPRDWWAFLEAYRAAGGCAVPAEGDPWPVLDLPARALVVQHAALGVLASWRERRPLDEVERRLIDACHRIAAVHGSF